MDKYIKIDIPQYPQYELHYSDSEQLIYSKKNKKYLKNSLNHCGYYFVNLYNDKGKKLWRLNRLVYICFNGEIPENMQVNHINECKSDNRIENLNLMTPKDNCNYGTRNQRQAEKMLNHKDLSKQVVGVNKNTLDVIEFPSAMQAQRVNKRFRNGDINQCCQHKKVKSVNNYYWFYKNEFNQLIEKYQGNIKDIIEYKISRY